MLRLEWARGLSTAARTGWGLSAAARKASGNCTFGKLPLGKNPLEVPNIEKNVHAKKKNLLEALNYV